MKKILITLLFVMFITSFINAKERKTLNTKHFEIIFTEESEDTALKIYNCAENMYENITAAFDTDINLKIPVTILHDIQVINAYFTSIPYNRIVLYDTVIEGSLDVFENSIEKIFYHELTHAITLNLKKPILRLMPVLSPTNFTLTTFWDEGATVYMESRESEYGKNEGRLNDPYSIQLAVQTILENKFPSWRDVTGARDISPSGTASYIFGGLFTNYLIEEYGLEKYAEFWKLANAVIPFSLVAGIFKKNYGTKIDNEWKKFGAKLKEYAEALNAKELENPLLKDSGNHQISYIEKYKDGIIYFDSTCNGIFEKTTSTKNKAKKILSIKNVKKLSASKNGRYIAISYYIYKSQIKAESLIYDTQKKRIIKIKEDDSRDITIVEENDDNLKVMVVKKYGLKVFDIDCKTKKIHDYKKLTFKGKEIPFSLCGNTMIIKNGMQWKIRKYDNNFESYTDYIFEGENTDLYKIRNLHKTDENTYTASYAINGKAMLPCPIILELGENSDSIQAKVFSENINGGIIHLVKNNEKYFVLSEFYENDNIFELNETDFISTMGNDSLITIEKETVYENKEETNDISNINEYKTSSYFPLKYYFHFSLLPVSIAEIYTKDMETDSVSTLGLTLTSSNPWNSNVFYISSGYDMLYDRGASKISLTGGNERTQYKIESNIAYDGNGFLQTKNSLGFSQFLYRGLINTLSFGLEGNYFYGHDREDLIDSHYEQGKAYFAYSTIHKVSPKNYRAAGIYIEPFIMAEAVQSKDFNEKLDKENLGATLGLRIPFFIPLSLYATLNPSYKKRLSTDATAYIFSYEIQKGIPAISLYANTFTLAAIYQSELTKDENTYTDKVGLAAVFMITPNTGAFTNSHMDIGGTVYYRPNITEDESRYGFSFISSISY